MNIFNLLTPVMYWILILLWSFILVFYIKRLRFKPRKDQSIFILLIILSIDALRTLFESIYFGAWYTALAGFLPIQIHSFLIRPEMVFIPKLLNVIAALVIIRILFYRWLPQEEKEKDKFKKMIEKSHKELIQTNKKLQNEIDEHERVRKDLLNSEQRLSTHLNNTPIGALAWNMDFKAVEWNPAAESIFGYTKDEVIGKHATELILPDDMKELVDSIFQDLVSDKGGTLSTNENTTKDGRRIICEWHNTVLKDNSGKVVGVASLVSDITERKLFEKKIKTHTENLKAIFNSTPNILILVNENSRVEMVNQSGAAFLGKKKEKIRGLLGGEVLNCLNSYDGKGCGRNADCSLCPVRTRIMSTIENGHPHVEEEGRMTILLKGKKISIDFLISTNLLQLNGDNKVLLSLTDITERKKNEQLIQNQQYLLTTAQQIGKIGTWELDLLTNKLSWTDENYRLFNIPIGTDLTYEIFLDSVHPDDREYVDAEWKATLLGRPYDIEHRILVNGRIKWVKEKAELEFNEKDECTRAIGFVQDITESKMANTALRESEEKFRLAFFTSPDAINMNRAEDGVYLEINDGFSKIMGYSRGEVIGKSSIELNLWKNSKERDILVTNLKKNGVVENLEAEFVAKDGQTKFGLMSARLLIIEDESVILSITRDITEKKLIEKRLINSEITYREYFEENLSGSYISTPEGRITDCNNECLKIFGFENQQHAFNTDITHLFNTADERYDFIKKLKQRKKIFGAEYKFKKYDGTPITVIENASGVFDEKGNLEAIRGNLLDITNQKKLEEQVRQSQKMESIGTLAGGIAHDFNNILFPILGHSEMLLEDISFESPSKASVKEIYSGALRAKELVQQILTFSRQEKSEMTLMKIQPILKEALKMIRSTIPTTIDILLDIDPRCGVIKADPTQIHQIIMNITTNAYHAMEENGGTMEVNLKQIELKKPHINRPTMEPGYYACLTVKDTGIGMDKGLIKNIFDPFFTTKVKGKGTGMGLSVVHGIVNSMKGDIQVHSNPGDGTVFSVYFPIEKSAFHKSDAHTKISNPKGSERILLVDDEEAIVVMEKQLLIRLGYKVTSRTSSVEALEAFRAEPDKFDLVITDMAMPNMSGDKLSTELVKIRHDIPVLLCTGFSETMSKEKAASLGIKGFLLKPIIMKDFSHKIREVLCERTD